MHNINGFINDFVCIVGVQDATFGIQFDWRKWQIQCYTDHALVCDRIIYGNLWLVGWLVF